MQAIIHIVLLLCVTLYSLSVPVTWGLYYLRADAVAEAYCVNPDKPSCHGKCHITKLTDRQKKSSGTPPVVEPNVEKPLLFFSDAGASVNTIESSSLLHGVPPSSSLQGGYPQDVYHPPS